MRFRPWRLTQNRFAQPGQVLHSDRRGVRAGNGWCYRRYRRHESGEPLPERLSGRKRTRDHDRHAILNADFDDLAGKLRTERHYMRQQAFSAAGQEMKDYRASRG
jgi:hypothetical protein